MVSTRGIGPEPHGMWQIPKGCTPGYTGPGVGELRLWLQRTQPFEMRSIPTCFAQCHSPPPAGGVPGEAPEAQIYSNIWRFTFDIICNLTCSRI